jgi:hypothetical protein
MRQLWAASVAPQRIRLLHVMPPERSHILAAAGLHGASSARSIALAAVAVRPIKKHAATIVFMLGSIRHVYWKRPVYPLTARKSSIFVRRTKKSQAFDNPWINWNFQGLGRGSSHRTATFRGTAMVKVPASPPGSNDFFFVIRNGLWQRDSRARQPAQVRHAARNATTCGKAMAVAAGLAAGSLRCMKPCSASG